MAQPLHYVRELPVLPKQVVDAFTRPIALRNWLCDDVYINEALGHTYLFAWNNGYVVCGQYKTVESEKVVLTWRGIDEPDVTSVEIALSEQEGGTHLELTHSGFGDGAAWEALIPKIDQGWVSTLEHLDYLLKTGLNERFIRRPMLGINFDQASEEKAAELGLPTREGILLTEVVEGFGAKAAGLEANDLLVGIAGKPIKDFGSLVDAIKNKHGGDTVDVEIYRGAEKRTLPMRLSERPKPQIDETPEAAVARLRVLHDQLKTDLDAMLDDASEEEAATPPTADAWSINEILAHIIFTERWVQMDIWGLTVGKNYFNWWGNNPTQRAPILSAFPTKGALVAEFKRALDGTAAAVAALPSDVFADLLRRVTITQQASGFEGHTREHYTQIREALALLRSQSEATPA